MSDTNSVAGIVKILETPRQKTNDGGSPITQFRAQFPQVRNSLIVNVTFWGNLALDVANYYKTNDYILIEGYLSLRDKQTFNLTNQVSKKVEVTVLKVYPFLLGNDRSVSEI